MSFLPSVIWWQIGTDCWPRLGIKKPRKLDHSLNRRYDGVWLTNLMFELTVWERRLMIDYLKFRICHMCNSRRHMHGHTRLITMPQPRSASTSPQAPPNPCFTLHRQRKHLSTLPIYSLSHSLKFSLLYYVRQHVITSSLCDHPIQHPPWHPRTYPFRHPCQVTKPYLPLLLQDILHKICRKDIQLCAWRIELSGVGLRNVLLDRLINT